MQKRSAEDANTHQQQMQQKSQDQNLPLSQGQRKQFKDHESQAQGTRQQLDSPESSQQSQAEHEHRQKLWNRCLRERQQIHQYQGEIQYERLQKKYHHSQQHVQPEPFHWQFTDEMQKLQDKVKQEKHCQERRQQFRDEIQEQLQTEPSHNEDDCPIPPEYQKAQDPPAQQFLNSQYQSQVPQNLTQGPQAPNEHRQQQTRYRHQLSHVLHHPQPEYQVWNHPYYQPWQPHSQDILRTLQTQYQHLEQQIQQSHWQQRHQSQEAQNQKRAQPGLQQTSQRPTEWQQAQYARREQQLQPRKGEKQTRIFDETTIPDHPPFPFVMDGESDDSEGEGGPESEEGEYESQVESDKSDNDIEVKEEEEDKEENEEDEEENLESESGFVMV